VMLREPLPCTASPHLVDCALGLAKFSSQLRATLIGIGPNVSDFIFCKNRVPVPDTGLRSSMFPLVEAVLRLCAPRKIFGRVVGARTVKVHHDHLGRTRPVECFTDKACPSDVPPVTSVVNQYHLAVSIPVSPAGEWTWSLAPMTDNLAIFACEVLREAVDWSCFHGNIIACRGLGEIG
jgi:hypothetical protein